MRRNARPGEAGSGSASWRVPLRAVGVVCVSLFVASCGLLPRQAPGPLAGELNTAVVPLARAALDVGQIETARRLYARLLEVDPGSAIARMGLGDAALREGARNEAIRWYGEAITYARSVQEARVATLAHARAALAVGDNEAAARSFGELANDEVEPSDAAWGYNGVGLTRLLDGDVAGAVTAMQEAVRLGPDEPRFRENLDKALALQRQAERRRLLDDAREETGADALDGPPGMPAAALPDELAEQSDMTRSRDLAAGSEPVAQPDERGPQDVAPEGSLRKGVPAPAPASGSVAADVPGERAPPTVDAQRAVEVPPGDQPAPADRVAVDDEVEAATGVLGLRELLPPAPAVPEVGAEAGPEESLAGVATEEAQPVVEIAPEAEDAGADDGTDVRQLTAAVELASSGADPGVVDEPVDAMSATDPDEFSLEATAADPPVAVVAEPDAVRDEPMPVALATVPDVGTNVEGVGNPVSSEWDDENGQVPADPDPVLIVPPELPPIVGLPPVGAEDGEAPDTGRVEPTARRDAALRVWRGASHYVEVGTYADVVAAVRVVDELWIRNGERRAQIVAFSDTSGDTSFRVVDGPFVTRDETVAVVAALDDAGFDARAFGVEQVVPRPDLFVVRNAGAYWVQAGAYGSVEKAMVVASQIGRIADLPVNVGQTVGDGGTTLYRTRIGPFDSREELAVVAAILEDGGMEPLGGLPVVRESLESSANVLLSSSVFDGGVVAAWRGGRHYVQAGIYADGATAQDVADELGIRHGRRAHVVADSTSHGATSFRILDGPFETLADTEAVVADLDDAGFDPRVFGVAETPSPPELFVVQNAGAYWMQAGAYGTTEKAMLIVSAIGRVVDMPLHVGKTDTEDGGVLYRVRIGPFDSREELAALGAALVDGSAESMATAAEE